jgi:hypothetical protein
VNESASEQLSEFLNDDLESPQTENLDATDDADVDSVEDPEDDTAPRGRGAREGLPHTFRMRHDAHYVEELMSRTIEAPPAGSDRRARRLSDPPPAAPVRPNPAPAVSAPGAGVALAVVADRLEALVTHAAHGRAQQTPPLVAQSIQLEFARAARLARAGAILQDDAEPMRRSLLARDIAHAAALAATPVARLSGMDCEVTVDDDAFTIGADAALVAQAIAGTVDALVDLLLTDPRRHPALDPRQPAPRVAVNFQGVSVRPAIIVDVICTSLFITGHQAETFFENDPAQYAGAPAAGILLAAAAHVVRAHGGRADVKRHNGVGVTVTYVFPQSAGEPSLT